MYDELVKRLRTMADWVGISFLEESENVRTNLSEAADAIEELSKKIDRAVSLYNRNVEKTAMYEALVGLSPEQPKEET